MQLLVALDALAAAAATWLAKINAFGTGAADLHVRSFEIPYAALMVLSVPTWLIVLATSRCYEVGPLGNGNSEARRVVSAGAHFLAVIAVAYYVAHIEQLGRGFLVAIVPWAIGLTLVSRAAARWHLHLLRTAGRARRRAVISGSPGSTRQFLDHLADHPHGGIEPVALLMGNGSPTPADLTTEDHDGGVRGVDDPTHNFPLPAPAGRANGHDLAPHDLPVIGAPDDAVDALARTDADLLVITGALAPGSLRRLTWQLEGTGVDVMVAPTAAHLAGPELDVRPVAGLPLLVVDHTRLDAPRLASLRELQVRRVGLTRTSAWRSGTRSRL